jgi:hypothetical protein
MRINVASSIDIDIDIDIDVASPVNETWTPRIDVCKLQGEVSFS